MLEKLKRTWFIWTVIATMAIVVGDKLAWAAEVDQKLDRLEQAQLKQAVVEEKIFDFTLNLWKIEPEQVNKWKKYPTEPVLTDSGDTVSCEWIVFEGFERLIKYMITQDSTGMTLHVDTLYEHKPDSL